MRVWLLGLFFLLAAAPTADGSVQLRGRTYVVHDLETVTIWVNSTQTAPESTMLRTEADADGDGTVTPPERQDYEAYLAASLDEQLQQAPQVRLDGQDPSRQRTVTVTLRGLEGPVTSPDDMELDVGYAIAFPPPTEREQRSLARDTAQEDEGPVRVSVAREYTLLWGTGIQEFVVTDDYATVSGRSDGQTRLEVVFMNRTRAADRTPGDFAQGGPLLGDESPAAAVGWILAAFASAGWGRRRGRTSPQR